MKAQNIVLFVLAVVFLLIPTLYYTNSEVVKITVVKTERITTTSDNFYIVYTTTETFKNVDNSFYLKWNSSDLQGALIPNKTYTVKVNEFRVPFLSMYRNILSIK